MAFTYIPIPLFTEENFKQCIVVPFPEGGKIVDIMVVDKTGYIMVEAHPSARVTQGHFHIVPVLQPLFADSHEYVGTYTIEDFLGVPLAMYSVIKITAGDYGIHSAEYRMIYGESKTEQVENDAIKPDTNLVDNEGELRKLWDFTTFGRDKTDDNNRPETDSESEPD